MAETYIDDRNPGLQYAPSSAWHIDGGPMEYNSSTHWTTVANATATLVFNGIGVGVYGTIASVENSSPAPPMALFAIDNSNPAQYSAVPVSGQTLYRQAFYKSPLLQNGQHTLVVKKYLNSSPLFLDYFVVSSSTPTSSSSSSANAGQLNIGAIVGGVLGGIILICSLTGLVLWKRRKAVYRREYNKFGVQPFGPSNGTESVKLQAVKPYTTTPAVDNGIRTPIYTTFSPNRHVVHAATVSSMSTMYAAGDPFSTAAPYLPPHNHMMNFPPEIVCAAEPPFMILNTEHDAPPVYTR